MNFTQASLNISVPSRLAGRNGSSQIRSNDAFLSGLRCSQDSIPQCMRQGLIQQGCCHRHPLTLPANASAEFFPVVEAVQVKGLHASADRTLPVRAKDGNVGPVGRVGVGVRNVPLAIACAQVMQRSAGVVFMVWHVLSGRTSGVKRRARECTLPAAGLHTSPVLPVSPSRVCSPPSASAFRSWPL